MPVQPSFQTTLINYLKRITNKSIVNMFLQYHSIPDSYELAKYLCETNLQLGLDMLVRLKKYDELFATLINKGLCLEALQCLKRYKVNLEYLTDANLKKLKKLLFENKTLALEFINA